MTDTPTPTTPDWTADANGRSNSSPLFTSLIEEVARLIRQEAHFLLQGDAESVARLIMAQLAHKHGLSPARAAPAETLDVERLAETEGCLLRECDHEFVADCVDDFRARLRSPEGDR